MDISPNARWQPGANGIIEDAQRQQIALQQQGVGYRADKIQAMGNDPGERLGYLA